MWGKVKSSKHIRRRLQNIMTKLPGVTGQGKKTNTPFETWNCLITDEIFNNIAQHTNQNILTIQTNLSSESDAKLTDKIEIKAFIILLCLAGALRSNKKRLEELCGTDGYGIISLSGELQILKVPIRCILE